MSVPPSTRRRSPPRLCTLRDRPIRVIYSRVNHNRHGRSIGRLRNDKQEYRPRFSFFFFFPFLFFFFFVSRTRPFSSTPPTTSGYYLTTTIANRRRVFLTRGERRTKDEIGWGEGLATEDEEALERLAYVCRQSRLRLRNYWNTSCS